MPGFYNVDNKADVAAVVTAIYKAWQRGEKEVEINGTTIALETPDGNKRVRMKVSLPASLQLFHNKEKVSWYLSLEDFYAYDRDDVSQQPMSSNPRIAGQIKEGSKGTTMFAFRERSFNEGYYSSALKAVRDHGVPVEYVIPDESMRDQAIKMGFLNKEGEVLFVPEENPRAFIKKTHTPVLKPVSNAKLDELLAACPDEEEEVAAA